jgi:hypothetical protein
MTLRDFNALSNLGKEEVLDLKGTIVTDRVEKGTQIVIYQVDNFYVEVHYDLITDSVRRYTGCVRTDIRFS